MTNSAPLIAAYSYSAPITKVWEALTDKDQMKLWYFDLAEFKPEAGFEFSFVGGTEENKYLHLCKITEVIPEQKLIHSWKYDGYEGESFVSFELTEEQDKTKLTLTHAGLETFPPLPDFAKTNFEQGWSYILGTSLVNYLTK
jgi:uncharacterized protein YndB with AHSA1/START domain